MAAGYCRSATIWYNRDALGESMKEYEVIWEIFNKCPRNQMRDVFVEEVEIEDPEEYIKKKFQGKEVSYDKDSS